MRKTIIFAALAVLAACTKETPEETCTVTFGFGNIITGTMTKSATSILEASAPAGPFTVKLTSKTNSRRTYQVSAGEPAVIAVDSYRATCTYIPGGAVEVYRGKVYREPSFYVDTEIQVEGDGTITLPASYDCWALIIDREKAADYAINNAGTPVSITSWSGDEQMGVVYVRPVGWNDTSTQTLTVTPADDVNYGITSYRIATGQVTGAIQVQRGRWYVFNPDAVETSSGQIGITFPEWEQGASSE